MQGSALVPLHNCSSKLFGAGLRYLGVLLDGSSGAFRVNIEFTRVIDSAKREHLVRWRTNFITKTKDSEVSRKTFRKCLLLVRKCIHKLGRRC